MDEASHKRKWLEEWEGWRTLPMAQAFRAAMRQQTQEAQADWARLLESPNPSPEELKQAHDRLRMVLALIAPLEELDGETIWNWLQTPAETQ